MGAIRFSQTVFFAMQPHTYSSEAAEVAFTVNHLTGRARRWGSAEWERRSRQNSAWCSAEEGETPMRHGVY